MATSRWSRLQSSPFGSSSLRSVPDSTGSQIRRLGESYGQALRILDREARRGDARSALGAIKVRSEALDQGFTPGGIRRKAEADAGILGRVAAMEQGAVDRERAAEANRSLVDESLAGDAPEGTTAGTVVTPPESRVTAALDIYEGQLADDDTAMQRGLDSARRLGVENPTGILRGDTRLGARRTLDTALGKAGSPEEIAALRERGARFGVTAADFNRRANWWERNRNI